MKRKNLTALLLAAALLLGLLTACGSAGPAPTEATAAPETTEAPITGGNDVTALSNYAVSEASPHDATMAATIAVNASGEPVMNNSVLQFAYWLEFFNFMNSYGSYASYFGLDPSVPLAEQSSMAENRTWEQYFLEDATNGFASQYALSCEAAANNYALSEDEQAMLDDILDPNGSIVTGAKDAGFDSAEAYMQSTFGPGVDLQDYYDYVKIYLTGNSYYSHLHELAAEQAENADEAALSAYYDEHAEEFAASRVQKVNNVSVRHILITPEGEKDEETGDYSEEAWAAAQQTANEVYAEWQKNPTEDNFAALANEKSADPGSNTTGGLYEDFGTAKMVAEFSDWSFDPARAYGDSGIVKTSYGYHIMFFVGQTENKGWVDAVRAQMPDELASAMVEEICARYPVTFDFTRMRVFDIITLMATEDASEESIPDAPTQETVILPEDTFEP